MKAVKITKYTTAIAVLISIMAAAVLVVLFNNKDNINTANADAYIDLTKTPSATQVPAGTTVTYTYVITNITGNNKIENIVLTDDILGVITCPQNFLDPGAFMMCTASTTISVDTTNNATVTGQIEQIGTSPILVTAAASATVVVSPSFIITKTANPTTVTEEGTAVDYTVTVTNDVRTNFNLQSLDDDIYGDLHGQGDCRTPQTIAAGASYSCTFTKVVPCDENPALTDTVTATGNFGAQGDDQVPIPVSNSASATVNVACEEPSMEVTKKATPASITEDTDIDYEVSVTNNLGYAATLSTLTDNVYGDLNGEGNCATGGTIADGATYTCNFPGEVTCEDSPSLTDTVTAKLTYTTDDGAQNEASDSASATVNVACEDEPYCGDGTLDADEECDDGNTTDGDGCSATCTTEENGEEPGLATIHGKVYNDANRNRVLDVSETGIANVTVTLLNHSNITLESDQTDTNGDFSFDELDPETYALRETDLVGYSSSTPNDISDIVVASNDSSYHVFGDYQVSTQPTTPITPTAPTTPTTPTDTSVLPTTGPENNPYPLFAALALIPLMAAGYALYSYKRK